MEKLTGKRLEEVMTGLSGWKADDSKLVREYQFGSFRAAMDFVNAVANEAESAGHHPDIDIRYNKVKITLTTHDAGGVTDKDVGMAKLLSTRYGR